MDIDEANKEELLAEINGTSKGFIDNDPIGLPDEKDVENIKGIMKNYDFVEPGDIALCLKEAAAIREANYNEFGSTADKSKRHTLHMPGPLLKMIEDAYPIMFKNRKHHAWFAKHFPGFRASKRY